MNTQMDKQHKDSRNDTRKKSVKRRKKRVKKKSSSTKSSDSNGSVDNVTHNPADYFAQYPKGFEPYEVTELLDRAENLFSMKKKKVVLPDLDHYVENRKTYIRNIGIIAQKLGRDPESMRKHFSDELRAGSSFKEDGQLKLEKVFRTQHLNPVYDSYVKTLQCKGCKSIDTIEVKENRIIYLVCNRCKRKVAREKRK